MIRVLWICNLILPEFSGIYGVRRYIYEGWMSGMFGILSANPGFRIACCFPVAKEEKMINGDAGRLQYYSFHASMDQKEIDQAAVNEFISIISDFNPDVIQLWGTEYAHTYAAILAAEETGRLYRTIIHIQGLVSAIVPYYHFGVEEKWLDYACNGRRTMLEDVEIFFNNGRTEIASIRKATAILGRTSWDKAYVGSIARGKRYKVCGEILRGEFYSCNRKWELSRAKRHNILISQASYPVKGLHLIMSAFVMLRDIYDDLSIVIAGENPIIYGDAEKENPYARYILELIERYGLKDLIRFTGPMQADEMIELYLSSHIFVCPSTIENSSNSIGEAQYLGVPVVASYTGGTPDLVEHGRTGLLYQMDASYMFASCVERIFEDDGFAVHLSEEEQRVAAERYDPERVSGELIRIYKEIAEAK